ncbi:hypothetical protein GCM10009547_44200 [Sporichthya brevicatena]|uniref:Uncharacterized protein n=1 Tax=Sporichthya brevicatena TaxID=171442 RepID=A0ABN1HAB9_9ACTN
MDDVTGNSIDEIAGSAESVKPFDSRMKFIVGGAAAVTVLAGVATAVALTGGGADTSTPEGALRAASSEYNNAMIGKAPAKNLLKFLAPQCTEDDKKALLAAPAMAKLFAPGVTGFKITKITIAGDTGRVFAEATGPGAEMLNNLADTGEEDTGDEWRLIDGKWYPAEC